MLADPRSTRPSRRSSRRGLLLAAVALPLLIVGSGTDAVAAKKRRSNPLTRHFAGLQVGPGHEFRLLTVHPLHAQSTLAGPEDVRLAAGADPNTYGLALPKKGRTRPMHLENFADGDTLVLPGRLVRSDLIDIATSGYAVASKSARQELPVVAASSESKEDEARPERVFLDVVLPPTLRWTAFEHPRGRETLKEIDEWAGDAGLETGRRSAAELHLGTAIEERVREYSTALGRLSRPPAGLQAVGYAAVLDGTPLVIETFADGATFTKEWPALVRALAVEAAVIEARAEVLDEEIPASGQPDRFLSALRKILLTFYGDDPDDERVSKRARHLSLQVETGKLHAVVFDGEHLLHTMLVTDPRRRGTEEDDDFDLGYITRKIRPTPAEERFAERRSGSGLPPRPPTPPVTPPIPPTGE